VQLARQRPVPHLRGVLPKMGCQKNMYPEYKFDKCVFGDSFQGSRNSLAGVAGS